MTSADICAQTLKHAEAELVKIWRTQAREALAHQRPEQFGAQGAAAHCARETLGALQRFHLARNVAPEASLAFLEEATQECARRWDALDLPFRDRNTLILLLRERAEQRQREAGVDAEALLLQASFWSQMGEKATALQLERTEEDFAMASAEALLIQHLAERFLAHSSHDIRTPLTAILGFAEILQEEAYGALNEEQRKALGHIENSAQNLIEIVNNLLDTLRMRSGKLTVRRRSFALPAFLEHIYRLLLPLSQRKKVQLKFAYSETIGALEADENILRHVIYHLLASSLRATPAGGEVCLEAQFFNKTFVIEVQDTALHLPPKALTSLQSHLPRIENSPLRGYEGWEVGLPLVRHYVKLHEGAMEIKSLPEAGTHFRISIPT